ncbi:hypothetical protein N7532_003763 [Penicillium argentinense]|uniref:DUF7702 domain-containing protein n=1 Tax=Penicillium argentinense TaxID=1131581 RepID=A0A9W9FN63_9EURO|nr:uncharacterized protein N7532_003763 [Penicillium argentinense]KAJ5103234.1 hypothetical protein N7532_003763 [Penicillium argentinense]
MSNHLFTRSADVSISTGRRNFAIADLILFSIIHLIQMPIRYKQEWKYWHHRKKRHPGRCFTYSWFSMIGLLSQLRIASSAMVISTNHTNKSMLIAESCLQSVGLSPLLFEVSLVLLRSGQAGEYGRGNSKWTLPIRIALHGFRFPVFISIVLAVVGGIIDIHPCGEAGSAVLVVTFVFVCGLVGWLAVRSRSTLPVAGHRGILLTAMTLPFLLVRIIYFLLQEYGPSMFSPASGSIRILVGMGLLMEIIVISLLLVARGVIEPILGSTENKRHILSDNAGWARN